MDPNILHLAIAGALTLVFVVITALTWSRAQVKTVFWWIGFTLVPLAVYLLGLAPSVVGAVDTLTAWARALEFTPVVWVGVVLASLAGLLMVGSRLIPSESFSDRRAARKGAATTAAQATASRPAVTPRPASGTPTASGSTEAEFDEIADLLRKRGIN